MQDLRASMPNNQTGENPAKYPLHLAYHPVPMSLYLLLGPEITKLDGRLNHC